MTSLADLARWWALPGPCAFVERVMKAAVGGDGVTVLEVPSPRPQGLVEAIAARFADELVLRSVEIDGKDINPQHSVAHELASSWGLLGSGIGNIADFVRAPELSEVVFIVEGLSRQDLMRWGLFIRGFREERRRSEALAGPFLLIFLPPGLDHTESKHLTGHAVQRQWLGYVSRLDSAAWLAILGFRQTGTLLERIGLATAIEVAAWSRDLLEMFARLDVEQQVSPFSKLEILASGQKWPFPCWENGLVDLWEDVPVPHAAAALAHSIPHEIDRRIWAAQNSVILPFVDEIRRGIIRKYLDVLERYASPEKPYVKTVFDRQFYIDSPWHFEWHELRLFLDSILTSDDTNFFKACRWARDQMAHARPIGLSNLKALSDWWEALRDGHAAGVTGWDWPRAGQMLTLTVGPSAVGKSAWATEQGLPVVSWEGIRQELASSINLANDQTAVFRKVRQRAASLMRCGSPAIIDATNIDTDDRLRNVNLVPPDIPVRYVVIDRSLDNKLADQHRRKVSPGLVETHHDQFQMAVENILNGDGRTNVSVTDLRTHLRKVGPQ